MDHEVGSRHRKQEFRGTDQCTHTHVTAHYGQQCLSTVYPCKMHTKNMLKGPKQASTVHRKLCTAVFTSSNECTVPTDFLKAKAHGEQSLNEKVDKEVGKGIRLHAPQSPWGRFETYTNASITITA